MTGRDASCGCSSYVVRATSRSPAPIATRVSVTAGISEMMRSRDPVASWRRPASSTTLSAGVCGGAGAQLPTRETRQTTDSLAHTDRTLSAIGSTSNAERSGAARMHRRSRS